MSMLKFKTVSRKALLLASLALGLTQAGCAHPVVVEPSVVISSRIGHAPLYAQLGVPGHVVVLPPVVYPPPPVLYAPPMYRPAPAWGHGQWHQGWRGRGDGHPGDGRRQGGRGHHDDWRR